MRLIELWLTRHGKADDGAMANFVRFQNSTSLRFPSCELEAIVVEGALAATITPEPAPESASEPASEPASDLAPDLAPDVGTLSAAALSKALASGALKHVHLVPTFVGLTGGAGALPVHYTERIVAHAVSTKDHGPRAFMDLFSNRSLALFYQGWRKYRLELKAQQNARDGFLPLLLSLAGLGNPALRRRLGDPAGGGVLDESLGHFAAALRQRPASAVQIGRVLSAYFAAPIRIEQFVGNWYAVPESQQTRIGVQHCVLGGGALAGGRVWQRDLRMRVVVGPLGHAAFEGFLPGGPKARSLRELLGMFTGVALEYEVQLVLRAADVLGVTLGTQAGARLGWDSFLAPKPPPHGTDRGDVRYELMAL